MKLIVAIVQDQDVNNLMEDLMESKYRVTRLASTGGFLRAGNTTLLIGVEEENVSEVIGLIENNCTTRKATTSMLSMAMPGDTFMPYPMEVRVGGATVFVLDVSEFIRV